MTSIASSLRRISCLYLSHISDYRLALAGGGFCCKKNSSIRSAASTHIQGGPKMAQFFWYALKTVRCQWLSPARQTKSAKVQL